MTRMVLIVLGFGALAFSSNAYAQTNAQLIEQSRSWLLPTGAVETDGSCVVPASRLTELTERFGPFERQEGASFQDRLPVWSPAGERLAFIPCDEELRVLIESML